jgi:hypothetical protein
MLKSITSAMQILDDSTGELITIYPAKKSSSTTVKVTFK